MIGECVAQDEESVRMRRRIDFRYQAADNDKGSSISLLLCLRSRRFVALLIESEIEAVDQFKQNWRHIDGLLSPLQSVTAHQFGTGQVSIVPLMGGICSIERSRLFTIVQDHLFRIFSVRRCF